MKSLNINIPLPFEMQGADGYNHYKVRARMAVMDKNFKLAENIYMELVRKKNLSSNKKKF